MKLTLASIGSRTRNAVFDAAAELYLKRIAAYVPIEAPAYGTEEALLEALTKQRGRTPTHLVLLDGAGKQLSSSGFAALLGEWRDAGRQSVWFAIGPADGWAATSKARADMLLSLGAMTLPHELARVVVAEQIYRAFTILAGHPYHTGH